MENDYLLDTNMEAISPPSSPNNQSPNSFSRNLIGRLGITSQGSETVIHETQHIIYNGKSTHYKSLEFLL